MSEIEESNLIEGLIPHNAIRIEFISSHDIPKQRDFITDVLRKAGPSGLYVNQMYHAWCRLLEQYGRKIPSYASFRKAIHNLHTVGVIVRVPPNETPGYDPLENITFQKSYYRLPSDIGDARLSKAFQMISGTSYSASYTPDSIL